MSADGSCFDDGGYEIYCMDTIDGYGEALGMPDTAAYTVAHHYVPTEFCDDCEPFVQGDETLAMWY